MNSKESKELGYFPSGLDAVLSKKFGNAAKFKSEWNFFT